MKAAPLILACIVLTEIVSVAIEPVVIRVAGQEYFTPSEWNDNPVSGPAWVTNYTVPPGRILVADQMLDESDDGVSNFELPIKVVGDMIEIDYASESSDSNVVRIGGLKLGPGWQLPGEALVEDVWNGELRVRDYKYTIFGYLIDTSTSSTGMLSTIESPMLLGNQLRVTVATPQRAERIAIEKSRKLQGDWTPVDDATVQPTADPTRQTVTIPATDPQAFIRATAATSITDE